MKTLLTIIILLQPVLFAIWARGASEAAPEPSPAVRIDRYLDELSEPLTDYEGFVDRAVEIWKLVPTAAKDTGPVKSWTPEKDKELEARCLSEPMMSVAQVRAVVSGYKPLTTSWELFFLCRAAVEKDPRLCAETASLREKPGEIKLLGSFCREGYEYLDAGSLIIARGPGAVERCEKLNDPVPGLPYESFNLLPLPKDKAARREVCSAIVAGAERQAVCSRISKLISKETGKPVVPHDCLGPICVLRGEASSCPDVEADYKSVLDAELFRVLSSYRKAVAAKDAELCGDSSLCRFYMGSADKSCADHAQRVKKEYCSSLVPLRREAALKNQPPSTSSITPELAELRGLVKSLVVYEMKRPRLPEEQLLVEELKKFMLQTEKFISVRAVLQDIMKVKQAQFTVQFEQADRWVGGFEPRSDARLPNLQKKLLRQHKRMEAAFKKFKSVSDR